MKDPAVEVRRLYLEHCAACRAAGVDEPSIDEWIALIDERIAERQEGLQRDGSAST